MSASGLPLTLVSGQFTRIADTDTLYAGTIAPLTTNADLNLAANGTGEVKLGAVGKNARVQDG